MRNLTLNDDLQHKARLLRDSRFFVDTSGDGTSFEKETLFLVLAGAKPVGEASSGHWVSTADGRRTVADDPGAVGDFLASLGLAYHLSSFDGHATDALVAIDQGLLAEYLRADAAHDVAAVGRLFGYPETAAVAFAADSEDQLLNPEEADRRTIESGLDPMQIGFRLSKAHWADELKTASHWQALLIDAGFVEATDDTLAA